MSCVIKDNLFFPPELRSFFRILSPLSNGFIARISFLPSSSVHAALACPLDLLSRRASRFLFESITQLL